MKRKSRKSRLMMDFMELSRETTRFRSDAQYLPTAGGVSAGHDPQAPGEGPGVPKTYLVTLKIRSNLRARNTLIPNDVPGLMTAQMTSKMLPMMTWKPGPGLSAAGDPGAPAGAHSQAPSSQPRGQVGWGSRVRLRGAPLAQPAGRCFCPQHRNKKGHTDLRTPESPTHYCYLVGPGSTRKLPETPGHNHHPAL